MVNEWLMILCGKVPLMTVPLTPVRMVAPARTLAAPTAVSVLLDLGEITVKQVGNYILHHICRLIFLFSFNVLVF